MKRKHIQNKNFKIWKYLDFTKFVSLLETDSLYFAKANTMIDRHEGIFNSDSKLSASCKNKKFKKTKNLVYLNCWHINKYESAAMWSVYLQSNEGIAIQSTRLRMEKSFQNKKHNIQLGEIKYTDYQKENICNKDIFYPFFHKRKSFEYEKEFRALIYKKQESRERGIFIPIDIKTLIEKIYVAPTAEEWIKELVQSLVKKYNINVEVIKSNLFDDPVFLLNSSFSILEVAFMELGVFVGAILFHFLTLKFLNAFGGVKRVMIWSYVIYILMYLALRYTDFLVAGFGKVIFLIIIAVLDVSASCFYWTTHHVYFFKSTKSRNAGKKLGILLSVPTIAGISSPFLGSILIDNFSFHTTFLVSAILMIIASSALFFSRDIKTEIDMSLKKSFNFHNPRTNIIFFIQGLGYAAVGFIWPILLFLFSIELISMGFLYLFSNIVYAAISYFGGKKTDNDHSNLIGRVGAVGHGFSMIFRALSTTILAMTAFQTMGGFFGGLVHIAIDADFFRNSHKDMANAIMCREIYMNLGRAFLVFSLIKY